ncbi:Transmembrane 45B [Micractinium conductrix]|uniref:Transmembrane 45B n=1 Tax=Micractinium conductrix TaxID=554055 RepID=A0A2P6VNH0_9CHLO|nr:Transmembrane 45B [Micractinium conductrix]|eukprot:PSC75597.1 Transmembrane 45B [Micractinium conductrix]
MDGMGGGAPAAHDHSAHAAHGAGVDRLPGGRYHYPNGGWNGHMLPGSFFLAWGLWWTVCTFGTYLQSLAARRPFRTAGWQRLPWGARALRNAPMEPFVKLILPVAGILGELWLGHEAFRGLYDSAGHFTTHINDWQHSTMYLAFTISGLVDLLCHYLGAPQGTELAFLGMSFLSEGLLLIFHLKGPRVEVLLHLILGLQVFATVVAVLVELAAPSSILAASARPWLTMLQGIWWMETARIMYTSAPQWDPDTMQAGMMVPVPLVCWGMVTAAAMLLLLLVMKAVTERRLGRRLDLAGGGGGDAHHHPHAHHAHQLLPADEEAGSGDVELSGLIKTPVPVAGGGYA